MTRDEALRKLDECRAIVAGLREEDEVYSLMNNVEGFMQCQLPYDVFVRLFAGRFVGKRPCCEREEWYYRDGVVEINTLPPEVLRPTCEVRVPAVEVAGVSV